MYCKRILILQQTDFRFALKNKELCGMVKLVNDGETKVTVFVTNADSSFGEWWLLLSFDGKIFARKLDTLNNAVFSLPTQSLENICCLLVKKQEDCFEVAQAQYGKNTCGVLRREMKNYICSSSEPFQQFAASTEAWAIGAVSKLKTQADSRYKSVEEYSMAFERYYASGGSQNYYLSVQREIGKVFVQFPPYYPLIRQYSQSFFVKIDFPSSEKYFVLGLLQQDGEVKYICYGLPAEKQKLSDKDFVFVESSPTSFWMLFQDAVTGAITQLK